MDNKQKEILKTNQVFDFEKLEVYKKAVDFANWIYEETKNFPKSEQFGIVSQLRRAALSISLNIAEGVGRYSQKERRQFYRMSRASTHECIPLVKLSKRQNYINKEVYDLARANCIELAKMISGLIKALEKLGTANVK